MSAPQTVNSWLDDEGYLTSLGGGGDDGGRDVAEEAIVGATSARPSDFAECVVWALRRFATWFDADIRKLLNEHPPDARTETGAPFWSGTRRCPRPTPFDADEPAHVAFVAAAARLRARTLGLAAPSSSTIEGKVRALTTDAGLLRAAADVKESAAALDAALRMRDAERVSPELFEKDDDENGHMAFVHAASNLRAANYGIAAADFHVAKRIAGRIVPAIATTTAAAVGLISMELIKLVTRADELTAYRNWYVNLALPLFAVSEPEPAEEYTLPKTGINWNLWSKIEVRGGRAMSLQSLVNHLEARLQLEVSHLSCSGIALYSTLAPPKQQKLWLGRSIEEVVDAAGGAADGSMIVLQVDCYDPEADEDVAVPTVVYVPLSAHRR